MTQTTNVRIVRNDGNSEFNLKCEAVESNVGNNMVARAILSAAGDMAGADPVINTETYQLTGIRLADIDDGDYPEESGWFTTTDADGNTKTIPSSDHEQRMEAALRHATKEWGPDASNNFDQLIWNDQSIDVVITSFSGTEHATQPAPGQYTANMELTHVDVYVG
jgi:hypothetical protein